LDTNLFLFLLDNEEVCDCGHMTCHIMWGHKPRFSESRLKGTRKMILGHMYIVWYSYGRYKDKIWWKHGQCIDFRARLK